MSDKLEIPRLKVKKNWHVGLSSVPVDRSHPDVHDDQLIQEHLMESVARKCFLFLHASQAGRKNSWIFLLIYLSFLLLVPICFCYTYNIEPKLDLGDPFFSKCAVTLRSMK